MSNQLQKCSNHADMVKYIGNLQLGEYKYDLPGNHTYRVVGLSPDNKRDGYIIGGRVATFTDNVMGHAKQDILNAALLAQLAANKKHDREQKIGTGHTTKFLES